MQGDSPAHHGLSLPECPATDNDKNNNSNNNNCNKILQYHNNAR